MFMDLQTFWLIVAFVVGALVGAIIALLKVASEYQKLADRVEELEAECAESEAVDDGV